MTQSTSPFRPELTAVCLEGWWRRLTWRISSNRGGKPYDCEKSIKPRWIKSW